MSISNHRQYEKQTFDKIIELLTKEKGYPKDCLLVEERLKLGSRTVIPDILITDESGKNYIGLIEIKNKLSEENKVRAIGQVIAYKNILDEDLPIFLLTPQDGIFEAYYLTDKAEWIRVPFNDFPSYTDLVKLYERRNLLKETEKRRNEEKKIKTKKYWSSIGISIATLGIIASMLSAILTDSFQLGKRNNIEEYKNELYLIADAIKTQQTEIDKLKTTQHDSLLIALQDIKQMIDTLDGIDKTSIKFLNMEKTMKNQEYKFETVIDSIETKISNLNTYLDYDLEKAFTVKLLDAKFAEIDNKIDYELKLQAKEIGRIEGNFKILMTLLITVLASIIASFIPNLRNNK